MDSVPVDTPVKLVLRRHPQPPQVLRLPRGQRIGMNGRDVGIGKQGKHAQKIMRADSVGKDTHGLGVEDVAAQRGRHFEVATDESCNEVSVERLQLEPAGDGVGQLRTGTGVRDRGTRFAGVVQQGRQQQQLRMRQIAKEMTETQPPGRSPPWWLVGQGVKCIDQHKGVLVHGVAVIGIAEHQRIDAVKLRNHQVKDAQRMHGAQCLGGETAAEHTAQPGPQARSLLQRRGQGRYSRNDPFLALRVVSDARLCREPKGSKDDLGIPGRVEIRSWLL